MNHPELDEVDRGILHMLQRDARNNSATDIADAVGVAANTVRNRIESLETEGIVRGYHPHIDYEAAGYQLRVNFVCTVPVSRRAEIAERALDIEGTVRVFERLSGRQNLAVETVGEDSDDVTTVATQLEDLGCDIVDEWFLRNDSVRPFDHFGVDQADES